MIPSVVAEQLRRGLEDYLRATFPITTPHFDGLIDRLLAEDRQCFKGPYVSVGLPYKSDDTGRSPLTTVALPFRPFVHQQRAFERLTRPDPAGTIVATGTGRGKTECFLYPILDYCARHRGERGIKAIVIYPMNALAADQAQRIAAAIHGNEALRGYVTAGLYIGEREAQPSDAMTAERIITDRDRLRSHPPDILLTNYKMLDLLLMRPADQGLWSQNGARTLRFLVVDELHTFDGAQGTDLACLIRRLKARLETPAGWVAGIGTSATLGGTEVAGELVHFASQVFGERFEDDAVIGEERMTAVEFLAEHVVEHLAIPREASSAKLDANAFDRPDDYLAEQARLWLPEFDASLDVDDGRVALGAALLQHVAVQNLLKLLGNRPVAFEALLPWAGRLLGEPDIERAGLLLTSLLALVAHARRRPDAASGEATSLVETRLQLWLREWRRMVGSVEAVPRKIPRRSRRRRARAALAGRELPALRGHRLGRGLAGGRASARVEPASRVSSLLRRGSGHANAVSARRRRARGARSRGDPLPDPAPGLLRTQAGGGTVDPGLGARASPQRAGLAPARSQLPVLRRHARPLHRRRALGEPVVRAGLAVGGNRVYPGQTAHRILRFRAGRRASGRLHHSAHLATAVSGRARSVPACRA